MKYKYDKPVMKVEEFKECDILTTSGFDDTQPGDNDVPFGQ